MRKILNVKKLIYTIGAITSITLPAMVVVSCQADSKTIDAGKAQDKLDIYLDPTKIKWSGKNGSGTFLPLVWSMPHTYLIYNVFGDHNSEITPPTNLSNGDDLSIEVSPNDGYKFTNGERVWISFVIPNDTFN